MNRKVRIYCSNPDCTQYNEYYYDILDAVVKSFNILNSNRLIQKTGYFIDVPQLQCAKCLWQVNMEIINEQLE